MLSSTAVITNPNKLKHQDKCVDVTSTDAPLIQDLLLARAEQLNESLKHLLSLKANANGAYRMEAYLLLMPQLQSHKSLHLAQIKEVDNLMSQMKKEQQANILSKVLNDPDLLVHKIFPFVGVGQFVFVAGVNKHLQDSYKKFVSTVQDPQVVYGPTIQDAKCLATSTDTFYSSVCASLSCADYWFTSTNGNDKSLNGFCAIAAKAGSLPVLQWAHAKAFPWCKSTCALAARNGHLEVLKYAHGHSCPWDESTCWGAAKSGHLEILKWAHENDCPWDTKTCALAADGGHVGVLKYAHQNGCPWDEETCALAAGTGHLEVLKYAHNNCRPWEEETCVFAAFYCKLEALKYAHENGCPWDTDTCYLAAREGHLEVLKFAFKHGCPWDRNTCYWAARNGHLEVLKYAHENGCPWDDDTYQIAAINNQSDVLSYLQEQGCPQP